MAPTRTRVAPGDRLTGQRAAVGLTPADRWLGSRVARALAPAPLSVVLWDGTELPPSGAVPRARVHFRDRGALLRLIADPELRFGELFSAGRIEIEGDLVEALELAYGAPLAEPRSWLRLPRSSANSRRLARRHARHHYDIGNDFYALWLDREARQYTCAYYARPDATLEEAQRAKLEHVCRKVWLRASDRVVEAGCGWGGLALHMARHHGVTVRACNISREQIEYAREEARRLGLAGRVEFIHEDYRELRGSYDVFVSVGMLEHVGVGQFETFGAVIDRCLGPSGRGLVHTIGRDRPLPLNRWITRYIFPGAYPPTLRETLAVLEPFGFSVLDVENLRLHYARTLRAWLERFESHRSEIQTMFDESFVRAWRLYLSGSVASFTTGWLQLFQVTFARTGSNAIPATREHLYRSPA